MDESMPEKANGQTPTNSELHRRQGRLEDVTHSNTTRINELERGYARMETKLNGLIETVEKHNTDSDKGMKNLDNKMDRMLQEPEGSSRMDMIWGGLKLAAFVLVILATSSTAVVMLL